jgi:hypothetical protein
MDSRMETGSLYGSSSPQDFVFTASDDLLTCSKKVDVRVSHARPPPNILRRYVETGHASHVPPLDPVYPGLQRQAVSSACASSACPELAGQILPKPKGEKILLGAKFAPNETARSTNRTLAPPRATFRQREQQQREQTV